MELSVKRALAPLAKVAHGRGASLSCEISPAVGRFVFGDERGFVELLTRMVASALRSPASRDVHVRLTRQSAGMAHREAVLVSVAASPDADPDLAEVPLPSSPRASTTCDVPSHVHGARVLVVAGSARAARITVRSARELGAMATPALGLETALAHLHASADERPAFDVVYVDDGLDGGADGLLRAIREVGAISSAPVVVASAGSDDDASRLLRGGASAVLAKPVFARELVGTIARLLLVQSVGEPLALAPRASRPPREILDLGAVAARTGGDMALVGDLYRDFLGHGRFWLDRIRDAALAGALDDAARLAHRLRGVLATLGAAAAAQAVADLEAAALAAKGGSLATVTALARSLDVASASVDYARESMSAFLEGMLGPASFAPSGR